MRSSVIVPSHNRPGSLAVTLRHLLEARSVVDFELVVVDDGSEPPVSLDLFGVRVVRTPGIERSRARNLGASLAKGSVLIFLDDDITVAPDFVTVHERAATEFGDALCVGATHLPPESTASTFGRFRRLIEDPSQARPRGVVAEQNFCTAQNVSMRRDTFLSLGGFDPEIMSSEDQDLAIRFSERAGRIVFLPEAKALHRDANMDITSYCRRHEWGARTMAPFVRRYPDRADNQHRLRFDESLAKAQPLRGRLDFLVRRTLSQPAALRVLLSAVSTCERVSDNDRFLFPMYRVVLGLHLFRGFREGLATVKAPPPLPAAILPNSL